MDLDIFVVHSKMNKYAYQLHTSAQKHRFWGGLAYIYIYMHVLCRIPRSNSGLQLPCHSLVPEHPGLDPPRCDRWLMPWPMALASVG